MNDPLGLWWSELDPTSFLNDPLSRPASALIDTADKLQTMTTMVGTLTADHSDERNTVGRGVYGR